LPILPGSMGMTLASWPMPSSGAEWPVKTGLRKPKLLARLAASCSYLDLSKLLIANSTTNSTKSSVSMSAYEIIQRSCLSCSSASVDLRRRVLTDTSGRLLVVLRFGDLGNVRREQAAQLLGD